MLLPLVSNGQQTKVNSIELIGNQRTKDAVILRELSFRQHVLYDENELSEHLLTSRNRLMNLNLFNDVVFLKQCENGLCQIRIELIERWYVWPIPSLEFSDRNFNVWQNLDFDPERTNYGLYLFNYNLFGSNHTMKLSLIQGYNQKIGLEYRIPFLSRYSPWGIDFKIQHQNQQELWQKTVNDKLVFYKSDEKGAIKESQIDVTLSRRLNLNTSISFTTGLQDSRISSEIQSLPSSYTYFIDNSHHQQKMYFGLDAQYDRRDNQFYPLIGEYLNVGVQAQRFSANSNANNINIYAQWDEFRPIGQRFYSVYSIYGVINTNDKLGYHDYKMLGYDQSIRGYEHYVSDGHAAVALRSSIKYHLLKNGKMKINFLPKSYRILPVNLFLELFMDIGRSSSSRIIVDNNLPNTTLASTGLGLNCLFYNDRVIRFEYSYNRFKEAGLYIHFKKAL
ncbi:MAG: BamA/TamA family outer membrane protein [Bacteroidia bacterium]